MATKFATDGLFDLNVPDGYSGESIFDDDYPIEDEDDYYEDDDYDYWNRYYNSRIGDYDPDPLDEEMGYDDYDYDGY